MKPVSNGSRKTSNAFLSNSGSSSRNNTPLCANDISPGLGLLPPPTKAVAEALWWGDLNGGVSQSC